MYSYDEPYYDLSEHATHRPAVAKSVAKLPSASWRSKWFAGIVGTLCGVAGVLVIIYIGSYLSYDPYSGRGARAVLDALGSIGMVVLTGFIIWRLYRLRLRLFERTYDKLVAKGDLTDIPLCDIQRISDLVQQRLGHCFSALQITKIMNDNYDKARELLGFEQKFGNDPGHRKALDDLWYWFFEPRVAEIKQIAANEREASLYRLQQFAQLSIETEPGEDR